MTRVLVPSGVLGLAFDENALARGIAGKPDLVAIDGGSTDSGPYYLGTGRSKYSRAGIKADWKRLMQARAEAGVPLVIGSCGTCGTDGMVDEMLAITAECASELGQTLRVACLYSSQDVAEMAEAFLSGRIAPLDPTPPLDADRFRDMSNIVALAGTEQIGAALETGADIVLAGRTTDTAIIAALPLMRGDDSGAAWHGAKVAECGALCSTQPTSGVIQLDVDEDGFEIEALAEGARCTPHSVSAHMLYENADPWRLTEPGGVLVVTDARYRALGGGRVRVTGSQWQPASSYTVKLEGTRIGGYQTTSLVLLRDARYVAAGQEWVEKLSAFMTRELDEKFDMRPEDYTLEFRLIGQDATLGALESRRGGPVELGVLTIVTADSQARASEIARALNPWLLHFPLSGDEELPSFAFPYSPAETERGPLFEFCLNHTLTLTDPMDAFRLTVQEIGHGQPG